MSWECVSYWIEHHPGLASWVQAVGSILAIFAAIWIANRDSRLRRNSEIQTRLGAIVRALTTVKDAKFRIESGFQGLAEIGASPELVDAIKADFAQSEGHLKEAMSIQGVDSEIYINLYQARTAVEAASHILYIVSIEQHEGETILVRLAAVLESLEKMKTTKN